MQEGDRYLRTTLVQGAHYILGPFGEDRDLRRWGLKLAARGGKGAKKKSGGGGGEKVGSTAPSVVGEWRGVPTAAQ